MEISVSYTYIAVNFFLQVNHSQRLSVKPLTPWLLPKIMEGSFQPTATAWQALENVVLMLHPSSGLWRVVFAYVNP